MTIRESRNTTPSKMRQSPILVFYDNQSEGVFHTHTHIRRDNMNIIIIIIINPSTARVVGAPQMTLLPVFSIFPCSPLPSRTCQTPGLLIPSCCLPTSSSVCLVFFPLSLCLARWFWSDLMNGKHDHTSAVCVSLRWSEGLHVVQLPAGSWHRLPCWQHGLCIRCVVSCGSTSFPGLILFFGVLL